MRPSKTNREGMLMSAKIVEVVQSVASFHGFFLDSYPSRLFLLRSCAWPDRPKTEDPHCFNNYRNSKWLSGVMITIGPFAWFSPFLATWFANLCMTSCVNHSHNWQRILFYPSLPSPQYKRITSSASPSRGIPLLLR